MSAETFEKTGFYSAKIDGWFRNSMPKGDLIGDVFNCSKCEEQIQIQITYGPLIPKEALFQKFAILLGLGYA